MIACFAFGWFSLLADEYKQLGKHIAAGASFLSNIVFWNEAGYFDNAAETKPLQHLWSLGIEEQFYIIWPLLLWLAWKCKFNLLVITIFLTLVSFALNVKGVKQDIVAAFYSPQTRLWELLSGSLLAWISLYKISSFSKISHNVYGYFTAIAGQIKYERASNAVANALSFFGLLLLVYGFWRIKRELSFPGAWALIPVISTMLLLITGPKTYIHRTILSNKVAVWFGLISFPLYLWHWPLLSFARLADGDTPNRNIRIAVVLISILLAWVTYKFIELPIRFGKHSKSKVAILMLLLLVIGYVGFNAYCREGLPFRFNGRSLLYKDQINAIENAWKYGGYPLPKTFYVDQKYGFYKIGENKNNTVLFIGDSHSEQYWNTIGAMYQNIIDGVNVPSVMFASNGFPPKINKDVLDDPGIKTVIFSYYWAIRYGSNKVNQSVRCCGNGKNGVVGSNNVPLLTDAQRDEVDHEILATVRALQDAGKNIYFILDNPFGEEFDPHSMLNRSWFRFSINPFSKIRRGIALERGEPVRSRILKIAKETNSKIIDPYSFLCDDEYCPAFSPEGELLYKDYDHLSLFTSQNRIHYLDFILK